VSRARGRTTLETDGRSRAWGEVEPQVKYGAIKKIDVRKVKVEGLANIFGEI